MSGLFHEVLAAFLAEDSFSRLSYSDQIGLFDRAFAKALSERNDVLGATVIGHWVQACQGINKGLPREDTEVWIISNLTSKYMAVYDRVKHGCETMEKTRLAIFKEAVALWRAERTVGTIAAFEFCAAALSPVSKSCTVGEDGTGAMRSLQGFFVSEKYAETMLGMMRDKIGNGIYFGVSDITEWIDRYAARNYFSEPVITMLAIARSRLGGARGAYADGACRKACVHFNPFDRSVPACALHDEQCKKITAFDEIVMRELVVGMISNAETMATDAPGSFSYLYGDLSWEYLSLDNVSVKVILPADIPQTLRRDMIRRADIHASRFYATVMERAVTVAIWLYVPERVDSIARVRYDKYGENTDPVDAD